jgi:hypothetical protein
LYFEKTCFAGQSWETSGNAQNKEEKVQSRKHIFRNVKRRQMEKPTLMKHLGQDTTAEEAQVYQRTDQAKAVTRRAHQGAGAP